MTTAHASIPPTPATVRYERIAVAVDPRPASEDALVLAVALAPDADLLMLSVEPELERMLLPADIRAIRRETEKMLGRRRQRYAPRARTTVAAGLSTAHELCRLVGENHRQLLVIGSGRQAEPGEACLGHHTRALLDHLDVPVAIAPQGIAKRAPLFLRRIGVGFDGGPESRAALDAAVAIASVTRATLVVCGVVTDRIPPLAWPASWPQGAHDVWSEAVGQEVAALEEQIRNATERRHVRCEVRVARGVPAEILRELSAELDLLAIGSRRWGMAARLLLGGTGEALVHGTRCSLLIAPRPHREE